MLPARINRGINSRIMSFRHINPIRRRMVKMANVQSNQSLGSVLSIRTASSILSIRSAFSVLSINSIGSILSINSAGSILSIGSIGSVLSIGSIFSFGGFFTVRNIKNIRLRERQNV